MSNLKSWRSKWQHSSVFHTVIYSILITPTQPKVHLSQWDSFCPQLELCLGQQSFCLRPAFIDFRLNSLTVADGCSHIISTQWGGQRSNWWSDLKAKGKDTETRGSSAHVWSPQGQSIIERANQSSAWPVCVCVFASSLPSLHTCVVARTTRPSKGERSMFDQEATEKQRQTD